MKDPAILFYTQDFLTGTFLMTDAQVGKYIRLLCLQQQNGKLTEKEMLKICKKRDEVIWKKFVLEDGFYYNKRMIIEIEKRQNYSEKQSEKAKKRWNKNDAVAYAQDMPLLYEDEIENEESNLIDKVWSKWKKYKKDEFRFSYTSEVSENAAKNELLNLSNNDAELAIKIIEQSIANGWKGFFKLKANGTERTNSKGGATPEQLRELIARTESTDK
jgi:hypothetical protein